MQVVCFGHLVSVNFPFLCLVVLVAQSTLIYLIWFILVGKAYLFSFYVHPPPTLWQSNNILIKTWVQQCLTFVEVEELQLTCRCMCVCVWERNFSEGRENCIPTLPPPLKASIYPHKEVSGSGISFFMDAKYSAAWPLVHSNRHHSNSLPSGG